MGLVKESAQIDCDILKNFYEKEEKDIPQDLLRYCREFNRIPIVTSDDWEGPIPFYTYPEYPQTWDQDTLEEYMFTSFAIMSSQLRIFSVPIQNEGDSDIKNVYVSSVKDDIYYVGDDGKFTKKNESDKFDLPQGETKIVKFQMPPTEQFPSQQRYIVEVELREYFRIKYDGKATTLNREHVEFLIGFGAGFTILFVFFPVFKSRIEKWALCNKFISQNDLK